MNEHNWGSAIGLDGTEILLALTACTLSQKCKVNIRFNPTLSDEEIRQEAVKLVVADLERKAAEELQLQQQRAAEQEREAILQETQVY